MHTPLKNFELVYFTTTTTANKYYFPDLPDLRNAKLRHITAYHRGNLPLDPNGKQPVALSDFNNAFLTLVQGNDEIYQSIPLSELNPLLGNSATQGITNMRGKIDLGGMVINFSKSYISYNPAATFTIPAAGYSWVFGVQYEK